ncbi:MAG: hypothetical protein EOP86_14745 [Verrucomicrobiaceae bacterium]|nr:MAG: hypothetical protein EOP86_14745 [Verrucomicrobiaceae bacterium]
MTDHLASALLAAVSYIERRDVSEEIADEDVRVLEEIFHHLHLCSEAERECIRECARIVATQVTDARHRQSLSAVIENLDP